MRESNREYALALIACVDANRAAGMDLEGACDASGTSVTAYHRWRRKVGFVKPRPKVRETKAEIREQVTNYPAGRRVYGNLILGPGYQDLKLCTAWRWCQRNPEAMRNLMPEDPMKFLRERSGA